jgi:hypothetical protein
MEGLTLAGGSDCMREGWLKIQPVSTRRQAEKTAVSGNMWDARIIFGRSGYFPGQLFFRTISVLRAGHLLGLIID